MIRDKHKVLIKEIDEAAELSERYFHTKTDKTQQFCPKATMFLNAQNNNNACERYWYF